MSEQIVFKNESAVLRYHSEGIVHHEFLKRMVGKDFRDVLDKGAQQMVVHRATKWLSDDRKNTVLEEADEKWAQTEWFPRVVAAGWKYWAIVNPEKAVGQMQMHRNAKTFELGGIKVAMFKDPKAAMEWLVSVDAPARKVG